jgi:hypothetical protein
MTGTSNFLPVGLGARPPTQPPVRAHRGPVRKGAIITGSAVAAGFGLAMTTLPATPTPAAVAQAYIEARLDGNWATAWALLCRPSRGVTDFAGYAEQSAYLREHTAMPSDVDITVDDPRVERGPAGPYLAVAVTVSSAERHREDWQIGGDVPLVEEDGQLRVCPGQSS